VEHTNRPAIIVVTLLLVGGALASVIFLGGQTSRILSTVGGAIGNSSGGGAQGGSGAGANPDPTSAAGGGAGSGSGGEVADAAATIPTLLIVRTGQLHLEVRDLDAAVRAGDAAVTGAGGYVSDSTRVATGADQSAQVTYRVPSARWDAVLGTLRGLATTVDVEKVKTDEVTGQVVDLTARIANLRATEAALQAIMARAAKISDVLDVQGQLTTTRGEIEQLVAQKDHLVDQASFGSLAVTFHLPVLPAPTATPAPVQGWDPGKDVERATGKLVRIGQTGTSIGIWLTIVGLPLLLAGVVIAIVSWQLYRMTRWVLRRREPGLGSGA
jgi:hypothetical protein